MFSIGAAVVGYGQPPAVETAATTPLGDAGLTVNGAVNPYGTPTRYWFEYGPTERYGETTDPQSVPPGIGAYYREEWDGGLAGWSGGMSGKDMSYHTSDDGAFVRFAEPSGLDPNHIDGIGWLHLASYFYPGWHPNPEGVSAFFAAGSPDLRDARISLQVRGNDWRPNGSELVWWSQTQSNEEGSGDPRRPNWAYTGYSLNDHLQSGEWESVEYRLLNDSRNWTYAGNNVAQNRAMYEYGSVDAAQRDMDLDFFHLLAFVNPEQPPTGTIDFDDFEIAYRSYNLLLPRNGGQLTSSPPGDAATLTDGWRHGPERMWVSQPGPVEPLEFHYEFARPVTITAVQIHQHTEWPSREIEVLVTNDGSAREPLASGTLPESSPHGPNFAFFLQRNLSAEATGVRVRVLSGYRGERWGLGEIEVFGAGAVLLPDAEPFHVNVDLRPVAAGETVHYRLVAENEHGRTTGSGRVYVVPSDRRPQIAETVAMRVMDESATLSARVCPMGSRTESYFEYGVDSRFDLKTPPVYCGLQITPRTVSQPIADLRAGVTYQYRIVAKNEHGTSVSEPATLTTLEASRR